MKKILIINYEYPPLGGGGGVATKALAESLFNKGHKVTLLTSKTKNLSLFDDISGVEINRVPVLGRTDDSKASMISLLTWPITSIIKGIQLIVKEKPNVINTHFFAPTGPTGIVLSLLFNIPNVIYAHGADVYDPERINKTPSGKGLLSKLLKISLQIQSRFAKKIIVQSNDTKERLLKLIPEYENKIIVIPLPFKKPEFDINSKERSKNNFTLVATGRMVKRKGFNYLIEALSKLPKEINLNLIGDGPELEKLKIQAKEMNCLDRIVFYGFVDEKKKYEILMSSDCYVLSSLHEGMGVVLQEAMFCGLPIVSTNYGGQTDLIKNNVNGLLVDPENVNQMVDAILELYNDVEKCKTFGYKNSELIKNYFSENLVSEYERVLLG